MFFLKKLKSKALKVFFIYICVFAILVLIGFLLVKFKQAKALSYLLPLTVIIEYCLVSVFFSNLYKNPIAKRVIFAGVIGFIPFILLFVLNSSKSFSIILVIEFFLLILCSMYYFFEKMRVVGTIPIYHNISFWIVVGFLIYASGNIFAFVYLESVTQNTESAKQLKNVYSFVTISKNLIFSLGIILGNENLFKENKFTIPDNLNLDDFSYPKNDNPTS